jgi:hypothetical protein
MDKLDWAALAATYWPIAVLGIFSMMAVLLCMRVLLVASRIEEGQRIMHAQHEGGLHRLRKELAGLREVMLFMRDHVLMSVEPPQNPHDPQQEGLRPAPTSKPLTQAEHSPYMTAARVDQLLKEEQ